MRENSNTEGFKYSDETAKILAQALLNTATNQTRIGVISAPSVFVQLRNLLVGCFSHAYAIMYV